MKKIAVVSLSLLVAFASMSESSSAQDVQKRRRIGFFDRLFGNIDRPRARVETSRAWWEDDSSGTRIIRGGVEKPKKLAQKRKIIPVEIDPEDGENLGMGNLDYFPPRQVLLYDPVFADRKSVV